MASSRITYQDGRLKYFFARVLAVLVFFAMVAGDVVGELAHSTTLRVATSGAVIGKFSH